MNRGCLLQISVVSALVWLIPANVVGQTYRAPTNYGTSTQQQPPSPVGQGQQTVVTRPADPVVVGGKRAADLTDDEIREFLASKIDDIDQSEGDVHLLRVAPGYALTLTFDEPPVSVVLGDPGLASYKSVGRTLILSAAQRQGDTSMQVIFPGNRVYVYHLFISDNFVDAQTALHVSTSVTSRRLAGLRGASPQRGAGEPLTSREITMVADTVANYDTLLQEGALKRSDVKRIDVFRSSNETGFTLYHIYRFRSGLAALTFAFHNPSAAPMRLDASRLRIQMAESYFIPDYVSFSGGSSLGAGEAVSGFMILKEPPFSFDQPMSVVWK